MKTVLRIGLVVLLVALAVGAFWLYRTRLASQATATAAGSYTQVVEVKQGSLRSSLSVVGQLDAVQSADLAFEKMKGTVPLVSLTVQAGNAVKAGQVLGTIDPAPYQQARDQASSDLQAAEKKLADLKTPVTQLQFAQSDLAIAKAQYQLASAKDSLDKLVNPDIAKLQTAVTNAQTALAKAQADLATLQADKTIEDRLYKLRDTEAKASADYSRLVNETYRDSYYQDRLEVAYNTLMNAQDARMTTELQAQANLLKARLQVSQSQDKLATAVDALATAQAGGDPLALANAQLAVKDAQVTLAGAQDARAKLDAGTDATTLATAQADVDRKRLALADAEAALAGTKLVAPFDGTVLKVNTAVGNSVTASTKILTLADLTQMQVDAAVDETTIRQVKAGQTATMSFDALPGKTFQGKVVSVPLQGTLQGNVMVYDVPISLTGAENQPLLVGMTANVVLSLGQVQNALLVPAMAVQRANGQNQVLVVTGTDTTAGQAVPVEVGLSDGVNTQIVKGLNLGDKVLVQMTSTSTQTSGNNRNAGGIGGGIGGMIFGGGR